jgi:hypothetical protein
VKLAEGIEMTALGAWRVDGSVKMTSELLRSHGVELQEWSHDVKRVEANDGMFRLVFATYEAASYSSTDRIFKAVRVGSHQQLRAQAFPNIPATCNLVNIALRNAIDFVTDALDEGHQFLSILSRV